MRAIAKVVLQGEILRSFLDPASIIQLRVIKIYAEVKKTQLTSIFIHYSCDFFFSFFLRIPEKVCKFIWRHDLLQDCPWVIFHWIYFLLWVLLEYRLQFSIAKLDLKIIVKAFLRNIFLSVLGVVILQTHIEDLLILVFVFQAQFTRNIQNFRVGNRVGSVFGWVHGVELFDVGKVEGVIRIFFL